MAEFPEFKFAEFGNGAGRETRLFLIPLALAIPVALLVEILTLTGGPATGPLDFSSWSPLRMLIVYLINVCIMELVAAGIYSGRFDYLREFWSKNNFANTKRAGIEIVAGIVLAFIGSFIGGAIFSSFGYTSWRMPIISGVSLVALTLLIVHFKSISRNVEWIFLIICLTVGTILCVSVPPTTRTSWDDAHHYDSAVGLSYVTDAQYTPADVDAGAVIGKAEAAIKEIPLVPSPDPMRIDDATYQRAVEAYDNINAQGDPIKLEGTAKSRGGVWFNEKVIGYVPNAIGLWFGRLFSNSFATIFVFGKFGGLICYALAFFFGIRHLRSGKLLVSLLGLFPTTMFISTIYTYDAFCISLVAFAFSYFIGEVQRPQKKIGLWEALTIAIVFFIGAEIKVVYLPLALILLLISPKKFEQKRVYTLYMALNLIAIGIGVWLLSIPVAKALANDAAQSDTRGGDNINAAEQIRQIMADPIGYVKNIAYYVFGRYLNLGRLATAFSEVEGNRYTYFYYFRWNPDITDSSYVSYGGLMASWMALMFGWSLVDRAECDKNYSGILWKVVSFVAIFLAIFAACSALYITFTAVGLDTVKGMHNRYLFPCLLPIFLIFLNCGITVKHEYTKKAAIFIVTTILLWLVEYYVVFLHLL